MTLRNFYGLMMWPHFVYLLVYLFAVIAGELCFLGLHLWICRRFNAGLRPGNTEDLLESQIDLTARIFFQVKFKITWFLAIFDLKRMASLLMFDQ